MSHNKIQHYVPKCHLRPFCPDGKRAAINLYNISRDKLITGAPIRGQCARDFFYGKDGTLERLLQGWEGDYATIVAKASSDPRSIDREDLAFLKEFTLLQTFRTYGYVEKVIELSEMQHSDMKAASSEGQRLPPRMVDDVDQAVLMAVRQFIRSKDHVNDLDACLIANETRQEFITSDDPAIHTNRFHFQRLRKNSFGLGSSGAMLLLPLTPKLEFVAFDGNVYLIPERQDNFVAIRRVEEISAFNELQLLNARENLYYSEQETGAALVAEFKRCEAQRPRVWNAIDYFEKTDDTKHAEHFEKVEAMSLEPGREFLVAFHQIHVRPSRWTGILKPRLRPKVVDTGTGGGVIRPDCVIYNEWKRNRSRRSHPIFVSTRSR